MATPLVNRIRTLVAGALLPRRARDGRTLAALRESDRSALSEKTHVGPPVCTEGPT